MAKTNPIGVRFDEDLLNALKNASLADSPQKALNLYEKSYLELMKLKVEINNQPENKKRILKEREGESLVSKIDYKTPDEKAYDGEPLSGLILDEAGLTEPVRKENPIEKDAKLKFTTHWKTKQGLEKLMPDIPPAPERKDFKDNWAYLEAKAEWKEKYNQ